jgi:hypothetical protein
MISSGIHVYLNNIRRLPIFPGSPDKQKPIIENVDKMMRLNKELHMKSQDLNNGYNENLIISISSLKT